MKDVNYSMGATLDDVDHRMVTAIRNKPAIFAMEIADRVDCEICEVMPAMAPAIKYGIVIHTRKLQPNGIMGDSFCLAEQAKVDLNPLISQTTPEAEPSKVKLALAYMEKMGGSATNDALRVAMGLRKGQYPSQWLNHLLKGTKVHAIPDGFALGPEDTSESVALKQKRSYSKRAGLPGTTPTKTELININLGLSKPETETEMKIDSLATQPVRFACAIWNDGNISLVRDSEPLATLSEMEASILFNFLKKLNHNTNQSREQ